MPGKAEIQALLIGTGAVSTALYHPLTALGFTPGFVGRRGPQRFQAWFDGQKIDAPELSLAAAEVKLAVVAVKAFDTAKALEWTRELPAGTVVLPVGNGATVPLIEAASALRPDLVWRLGYCTYGVTFLGDGRYQSGSAPGAQVELGFGPLLAGSASEPTSVERLLIGGHRLFCWHPQVQWLHRRKWLFNTVINTLTAARRLPTNGLLLADLPTLAAVFSEAMALGETLWGAWPLPRHELYAALLQLTEATASNENSMARDIRLKRRTETEFLAGLALEQPRGAERFPLLASMHSGLLGGA